MVQNQIKQEYCYAIIDQLWIEGLITLEERLKMKDEVAKAFTL